jgi:hypothetical protein
MPLSMVGEIRAVESNGQVVVWGTDVTVMPWTLQGVVFQPGRNRWWTLPQKGKPSQAYAGSLVSAGGSLIVWGGQIDTGEFVDTGAVYDLPGFRGDHCLAVAGTAGGAGGLAATLLLTLGAALLRKRRFSP